MYTHQVIKIKDKSAQYSVDRVDSCADEEPSAPQSAWEVSGAYVFPEKGTWLSRCAFYNLQLWVEESELRGTPVQYLSYLVKLVLVHWCLYFACSRHLSVVRHNLSYISLCSPIWRRGQSFIKSCSPSICKKL
jgi:hypothetical protein